MPRKASLSSAASLPRHFIQERFVICSPGAQSLRKVMGAIRDSQKVRLLALFGESWKHAPALVMLVSFYGLGIPGAHSPR
jgi:hypothetical protein